MLAICREAEQTQRQDILEIQQDMQNSRKSTLNFQREQGQDRVNENEASDWTGEKLLAHHT